MLANRNVKAVSLIAQNMCSQKVLIFQYVTIIRWNFHYLAALKAKFVSNGTSLCIIIRAFASPAPLKSLKNMGF